MFSVHATTQLQVVINGWPLILSDNFRHSSYHLCRFIFSLSFIFPYSFIYSSKRTLCFRPFPSLSLNWYRFDNISSIFAYHHHQLHRESCSWLFFFFIGHFGSKAPTELHININRSNPLNENIGRESFVFRLSSFVFRLSSFVFCLSSFVIV